MRDQHVQGERVEALAEETSAAAAPEGGTIVIPVRGAFPHAQTDDQLHPTSRNDLPKSHSSSPARMKVGGAVQNWRTNLLITIDASTEGLANILECVNRCNAGCCTLANSCD